MASPGRKSPNRSKGGRISRSGDFDRVYKQGRSRGGKCFVAYAFERDQEAEAGSRLGITVGRKVGGAVKRNAVKRAVREAFGQIQPSLGEGVDFVVVARSGAADLVDREGTEGVKRELDDLFARLGPDQKDA